jgi:hypothetical protein
LFKVNQKVADSHFPALAEVTTVTPTVEVATVVAVEVATAVVVVTEAAVVSAVVPAVTACPTSALA